MVVEVKQKKCVGGGGCGGGGGGGGGNKILKEEIEAAMRKLNTVEAKKLIR